MKPCDDTPHTFRQEYHPVLGKLILRCSCGWHDSIDSVAIVNDENVIDRVCEGHVLDVAKARAEASSQRMTIEQREQAFRDAGDYANGFFRG